MRLKVWRLAGRCAFWVSWPGLWFYLHWSHRARVMVVCQGKLLVERTWLGDGRWGLPGGGLHKGEASIDGALRELEEETGIKLAANDLQFIAGYRMSVQGLSFKYDLFKTELNMFPQLHQQTGEIVDIQWLTVAELLENVIRPDVEEALKIWPV